MKIFEVDREQFAAWLNRLWHGNKTCTVCGSNSWAIAERISEVRTYSAGGLVMGGQIHPVIPVTCSTCGNTILFNAIVSGAMKAGESTEGAKEEKASQAESKVEADE